MAAATLVVLPVVSSSSSPSGSSSGITVGGVKRLGMTSPWSQPSFVMSPSSPGARLIERPERRIAAVRRGPAADTCAGRWLRVGRLGRWLVQDLVARPCSSTRRGRRGSSARRSSDRAGRRHSAGLWPRRAQSNRSHDGGDRRSAGRSAPTTCATPTVPATRARRVRHVLLRDEAPARGWRTGSGQGRRPLPSACR